MITLSAVAKEYKQSKQTANGGARLDYVYTLDYDTDTDRKRTFYIDTRSALLAERGRV